MHLPEDPAPAPQINIVPMIDVIFVILIFFMLSSLYLTRSAGLPVTLPSATTSESPLPMHTLTLTIPTTGALQLGNVAVTLDALPEQIQSRRVGEQNILIILQADTEVTHGQVVAVMDTLRAIANLEIAIATQPPTP
jgi:biopolymer transport protein ExbD